MRVSVIGQGYVGLSVAVGAASVGHVVVGVDSNDSLISDLKKSQTFVPGIKRELLNELITSGSYIPTTNLDLIQKSDVVIIAVPTPLDSNKKPDLSFLKAATLEISKTSVLNNPCNKLVNILFILEPSKNDDESIFFNIFILLILI
jgi:UDP-N-acetyl-D-glucosamine dehydrogenase